MIKIKTKQIKQYMAKEKYEKKKFCVIVGITEREFDKILNNDLEFKFLSLVKLARFLNVPVDWLLDSGVNEVQTKFYI